MILTDSHSHIYHPKFNGDRDAMMQRAIDNGVSRIFLPNIDLESVSQMMDLTKAYPNNCFPMMGLHPTSVGADVDSVLPKIKELFDQGGWCAVGEIGIDLYWDKTFLEQQQEAFRQQIGWAKESGLPIVIHARESFQEIFEIVDELNDDSLTGIFHCFTGTVEDAQHILEYGGFKLGIGGVVTYKKSGLPEVLQQLNLSDLVLETDSPYLPPVPYRGKRNESSYVLHVAQKVADIYAMPIEQVAEVTTQNTRDLFSI